MCARFHGHACIKQACTEKVDFYLHVIYVHAPSVYFIYALYRAFSHLLSLSLFFPPFFYPFLCPSLTGTRPMA